VVALRRRWYDFTLKLSFSYLAYPNQAKKEHDKFAKIIIGAVEKQMGSLCHSVRDCKTGRYRRL